MEPKISLIVAIAKNRAIGKDNKLLWYLPEDLKRFKKLTTGHAIIMGRKTFESIGKPLPNRTNIIVTRDPVYKAEGCFVAHSVEEAIYKAQSFEKNEIFIIGGGQIFEQALGLADKLYVTIVEKEYHDADSFFPEYSHFTKIILQEEDEYEGMKYKFLELEK
ncbi:MAG: dihydrofolate reductase [Patescibacteria group bacterium]